MSGKFDFDTVFNKMSPLQVDMANMALDIQDKAEKDAIKQAQRKRK